MKTTLQAVSSRPALVEAPQPHATCSLVGPGDLIASRPPVDLWAVFQKLTPVEMAGVLIDLARNVRLALYPKQPRGPKKPKPEKQSGAKIKHVATAKVLKTRYKRT